MTLGRGGSDIELDGSLAAYRAAPADRGGPGVLVAHGAWGLDDHVRDVCDRLAREGYVALAPDLFGGVVHARREDALRRRAEFDFASAGPPLDAAVSALLADDRVDGGRLGSLGFCMGGSLALFAAARSPRIGAAVDFQGGLHDVPLEPGALRASVLGVFGDGDAGSEELRGLEEALSAAGRRLVIVVLPGVGHAFMNDSRPDAYDARAAAEGWDTLLAFLRAELG